VLPEFPSGYTLDKPSSHLAFERRTPSKKPSHTSSSIRFDRDSENGRTLAELNRQGK
jgi:hypothetical protein